MSAATDINVRIPSAVYRALYPQARVRGVEVGALLVELALGRVMRETQPVKVHPSTDTKELPGPHALPSVASTRRSRRTMTDDMLARLREMHALGYTSGQIAAVIGGSRSNVQIYIARINRGEL